MHVKDIMNPHVVFIGPQASLPDAVATMTDAGVRRLPVVDAGRLLGVVTDDDIRGALPLITQDLTPWAFVERAGRIRVKDVLHTPPVAVHADADLPVALRHLLEGHAGTLPVVNDEENIVGVLTLSDVLRACGRDGGQDLGVVHEHMTRGTVTVGPDASASEAAAYLTLSRLRVLPVVEDGVLVGVVRQSDLRDAAGRAAGPRGETFMQSHFFLEGRRVRELMRAPADVVHADAPLLEAVRAMLAADVHGLPVISDARWLLGVITISDVLTALLGRPAPVTGPGVVSS